MKPQRTPSAIRRSAIRLPLLLPALLALLAGGAAAQYEGDCTPLSVPLDRTLRIPIDMVGKGNITDVVVVKDGEFGFDPKIIQVSPKIEPDASYVQIHVRGKQEGSSPLLIDAPDLGAALLFDITVTPAIDKLIDKLLKAQAKALKGDLKDVVKQTTQALKDHTTAVKKPGEGFDLLTTVKAAQADRLGGLFDAGDAGRDRVLEAIDEALAEIDGSLPDADKGPGLSRGACDAWDDFTHDVNDLVDGSVGKIDKAWKKFQTAVNGSGRGHLSAAGRFHFDAGAVPGPTGTGTDLDEVSERAADEIMEALFLSNLVPLPTAELDDDVDGEGGGVWHALSGGRLPHSDGDLIRRLTFLDGTGADLTVPTDADGRWSDCAEVSDGLRGRNFLEVLQDELQVLAEQTVFCDPTSEDTFTEEFELGLLD